MAQDWLIEGGPVGCEWYDVLRIKDWTYKGRPYRSLKILPGVTYVTVSPITGEICDLDPPNRPDKDGQYSLF